MKRKFFLKALCYLLAICLLSGCASKSPLLLHADDGVEKVRYATTILTKISTCRFENAEGEYICNVPLVPDDPDNSSAMADGSMDFQRIEWDKFYTKLQMPPSRYFVCLHNQTEDRREEIANVAIVFFKESGSVKQVATGPWDKAIYHCNNVVEVYGRPSELTVRFEVGEEKKMYVIRGNMNEYAVVALADGKVTVEGITGNYTVATYYKSHNEMELISTKEYDKDGNLLTTTEEG